MKFSPVFAVLFSALVICLTLAGPALAQNGPSAAPTGEPAQTQPLPAPTTSVDITETGDNAGPAIGGIPSSRSLCAPIPW